MQHIHMSTQGVPYAWVDIRNKSKWVVFTTWPCFMHRNLLLFRISLHNFTPKTWSQQNSFIFVSFHKRHSVPTYCVATRSRHEFWPPFFLLFLFAAAVLNFNLHTINGHTSVCKKKRKFAIVVRKMHVCCLSVVLWRRRQQLDPLALLILGSG